MKSFTVLLLLVAVCGFSATVAELIETPTEPLSFEELLERESNEPGMTNKEYFESLNIDPSLHPDILEDSMLLTVRKRTLFLTSSTIYTVSYFFES